MLVTIMSTTLVFYSYPSLAQDLAKLDQAGVKILNIVQKIGYWIILVKATKDVITSLLNGANNDISGIVIKYVIAYGSLFALPWMLTLVEGIF